MCCMELLPYFKVFCRHFHSAFLMLTVYKLGMIDVMIILQQVKIM